MKHFFLKKIFIQSKSVLFPFFFFFFLVFFKKQTNNFLFALNCLDSSFFLLPPLFPSFLLLFFFLFVLFVFFVWTFCALWSVSIHSSSSSPPTPSPISSNKRWLRWSVTWAGNQTYLWVDVLCFALYDVRSRLSARQILTINSSAVWQSYLGSVKAKYELSVLTLRQSTYIDIFFKIVIIICP